MKIYLDDRALRRSNWEQSFWELTSQWTITQKEKRKGKKKGKRREKEGDRSFFEGEVGR